MNIRYPLYEGVYRILTAISCMPDKFITMEMVELAAAEHRPELVNYLPEKYITSEILDSIFKTDDYGWRSWQLSKIPEENVIARFV